MFVYSEAAGRMQACENTMLWTRKISRCFDTTQQALRRLAKNSDPQLRIDVADHRKTTEETLMILASDENADVRFALAENHNISQRVLNKLKNDSNPYVADRAQRTIARLNIDDSTPGSGS